MAENNIKYPHPKLLLLNIEQKAADVLEGAGYNIAVGSFGTPYFVKKNDDFLPLIPNGDLPSDTSEREIIIIDLTPNPTAEKPGAEKATSHGELDCWASCATGTHDPRPRTMLEYQNEFDQILKHGGTFIIFARNRYLQNLKLARVIDGYFDVTRDLEFDNWSFLSVLKSDNLEVGYFTGKEISVQERDLNNTALRILAEYLQDAEIKCTVHPLHSIPTGWMTLATNKFGAPVAGAMGFPNEETSQPGFVFILPQLNNKPEFLLKFIDKVLPDITPRLYPHLEGTRWVQRNEYELPKVIDLDKEIQRIREEANQKIAEIEKAIEKERIEQAYLHEILTENDTPLVKAVKKALEVLGFQSVVDMDEEMAKIGNTDKKREDLQIREDDSPLILVEIKGINMIPSDELALTPAKYLVPRMKQYNRRDIIALSIINHKRNIPPLEREEAFRPDVVANAEERYVGLLTTWDLHRLVRNYLKNQWEPKHVKALFYQSGRIKPIPLHYEFLGTVETFFAKAKAVGVKLEQGKLDLGDRIAFELPVDFIEQKVTSLQVNGSPAEHAVARDEIGIATDFSKEKLKKGVRVFKIVEIPEVTKDSMTS